MLNVIKRKNQYIQEVFLKKFDISLGQVVTCANPRNTEIIPIQVGDVYHSSFRGIKTLKVIYIAISSPVRN